MKEAPGFAEVVRLSGINVTVDNDGLPFVNKVASLPNARLQVYFG